MERWCYELYYSIDCNEWQNRFLSVEDVPIHSAEGFLYAGTGGGQIHSQVTGTEKHPAVLDGNTDIPAGFFHILDCFAMGGTPVGAVGKEHVGAFRPGNVDTIKVPVNVITGKVYISA